MQGLVRQDLQELTDQAAQIVALRWLPDFWKAVHGQGRLRLTAAGLEIMIKDKHRLGVLNHATVRAVILLDATEQSEHFEQWLGQPVTHARQAMPQHGAVTQPHSVPVARCCARQGGKRFAHGSTC